jgi:hypothetical protein
MMLDKSGWQERWLALAQEWGVRLSEAGLDGLALTLVRAARPLGPLLASTAWVMQPGLGSFGYGQAAGALADLLDDPQGIERLIACFESADREDETCQR